MPAQKNPLAFILVPGSFSPASFWDRVTPYLEKDGHESYPTSLKSTSTFLVKPEGSDVKPGSLYDDAAYIREQVTKLLDEGKDVVVGLNSYAGFPGSESVKGLAENVKGKGRLLGLVYVASFFPKKGQTSNALMASFVEGGDGGAIKPEAEQDAGAAGSEAEYMDLPNRDTGHTVVFNDLPEEEGKSLMAQFLYQATASFQNELTFEGYKHVPAVTAIVPEDDLIIPTKQQHKMIADANSSGASVKTVEMKAGHCPMLSFPEEVSKVLVQTAEDGWAKLA